MSLSNILKTSTASNDVMDGSRGSTDKPGVSEFLTVQSFTNFAAMSGGITAAWNAFPVLVPTARGVWFPYLCAILWAVISYLISRDGLAKPDGTVPIGTSLQALFIGFINAMVLAGSVVGSAAALDAMAARVPPSPDQVEAAAPTR